MTRMTVNLAVAVRWTGMACTWFHKAAEALVVVAEGATLDRRWLMGYEADRLVGTALRDARDLVPLLNDYDVGRVEREALALARKARDRRLALALRDTEGRTEQEAAAFRRKADELGGADG